MNLLELPMEILQLIVDYLDLAHQLIFCRLCRVTHQLDITNFWNIKGVIKSTKITETILKMYPRIKWLNLKNNTNVKNINLINLEKIYVGVWSSVLSNISKSTTILKIYCSESLLDNLYPSNDNTEIIKHYLFKKSIERHPIKNLWKTFEKSERLNILSEQLTFSSNSIYPTLLVCAIKYCCIESVKMILTNYPDVINTPIRTYPTIFCYACLCNKKSLEIIKYLLTKSISENVCYNALLNVCTRVNSKQDVECIKILLDHCNGKKSQRALINICKNCNNKYSEECIKLLDVDPAFIRHYRSPIAYLLPNCKTKWAFNCLRLLVNKNNVNLPIDTTGETIINFICYNLVSKIRVDVLRYIISIGGDVNITDGSGINAILAFSVSEHQEYSNEIFSFIVNNKNIDSQDVNGNTALMNCCKNGNFKLAQLLINAGANINVKNNVEISALMFASSRGYLDIVHLLINAGVDLDFQSKHGWTSLMCVAENVIDSNKYNCLKALIDAKANIDIRNDDGDTALIIAVRKSSTTSSISTVEYLINTNANLNIQNKDGFTSLMIASIYSNTTSSIDTVKKLISVGCNLNIRCKNGQTALMLAIRNRNIDAMNELINVEKSKCDLDIVDNYGRSALMIASKYPNKNNNINIVKSLINTKCNLNTVDKFGRSALMIACRNSNTTSNIDTVNLLINAGADLNIRDINGKSALLIAVQHSNANSNIATVKALINARCNLDSLDKTGWSPLTYACYNYRNYPFIECVNELIDAGANINILNKKNCSCLMHAARYCGTTSTIDCVKLLIRNKADVNVVDVNNHTALMYAVENVDTTSTIECVRELINAKSDIHVKNKKSLSLLMIACKKCTPQNSDLMIECIDLLIDNGANLNDVSVKNMTALMYLFKYLTYKQKYYNTITKIIQNTDSTIVNSNGKIAYDYYLKNESFVSLLANESFPC